MQTARATRAADSLSGCPVYTATAANPFQVCPAALEAQERYLAAMVAFIVAFGISILGFVGGIVFMHVRNGQYASRGGGKIPAIDMHGEEPAWKGVPKDSL